MEGMVWEDSEGGRRKRGRGRGLESMMMDGGMGYEWDGEGAGGRNRRGRVCRCLITRYFEVGSVVVLFGVGRRVLARAAGQEGRHGIRVLFGGSEGGGRMG